MACGAEMILTNVVQDDMMGVPGFEHQTFMCSECHDLERRFVFTKQDRDGDGEPMPEQASPSVAPASTVHEEHVTVIDPAENVLVESTQVAPLELTQTAPVKTTVQVETSQMEPTIQNREPEPVASGLLSNARGPTQTVSVEAIQAAPLEVEPAAPIQARETISVEITQTVAVPVQSLEEPIASPAPTARDEPSGAEARPERPRRWWSWRELVR
jgi:hypothetical protein